MDDKELEEIKQKKLQEALQKQQIDMVKKAAAFKFMTKEARERLNRVKAVKPELAEKVELALLQAIQMGQLRDMITDEQMKTILLEVSEKKSYRILKR